MRQILLSQLKKEKITEHSKHWPGPTHRPLSSLQGYLTVVLHSWPASWASVCRCPLTLGQAGSAGELACQEGPLSNEEWERVGKCPRVLTSWWVDAGLSPTQPFGSQTGQEGEPSPGGQGGSGSGTVLSLFHVLTHSQCFLKSPHRHHHLRQAPCTQIPVSDRIS